MEKIYNRFFRENREREKNGEKRKKEQYNTTVQYIPQSTQQHTFSCTYIFPYPEINGTLSSEIKHPIYFNLQDVDFFSKKKKKSIIQTGLWGWC